MSVSIVQALTVAEPQTATGRHGGKEDIIGFGEVLDRHPDRRAETGTGRKMAVPGPSDDGDKSTVERDEARHDKEDSAQAGTMPGMAPPVAERLPLLMSWREMERAASPADNTNGEEMAPEEPLPRRPETAAIPAMIDGRSGHPVPNEAKAFRAFPAAEKPAMSEPASPAATPAGMQAESQPEPDLPVSLRPQAEADDPATPGTRADARPRQEPVPRVTVTAAQSFAAPAPLASDPTLAGLVASIAGDEGLKQAISAPALPASWAQKNAAPAHTLRIELHPAELGMVSARLHLAGDQLSIEIAPDTQEAWRHLSSDSETIVRSMRDLGFDIAKVTVLPPSGTATPAARADAAGFAGRDGSAFQPGQSGSGGGSQGERHASGGTAYDSETSAHPPSSPRGDSGGGLYI